MVSSRQRKYLYQVWLPSSNGLAYIVFTMLNNVHRVTLTFDPNVASSLYTSNCTKLNGPSSKGSSCILFTRFKINIQCATLTLTLKIPEVSDETGALLVYSCFITYKSFSHRPTSMEHTQLLDMWTRVNPEFMFFKNFRGKLFENGKRYAKSETTVQRALDEIPNHILHVQFERKTSVSQSNLLYP